MLVPKFLKDLQLGEVIDPIKALTDPIKSVVDGISATLAGIKPFIEALPSKVFDVLKVPLDTIKGMIEFIPSKVFAFATDEIAKILDEVNKKLK